MVCVAGFTANVEGPVPTDAPFSRADPEPKDGVALARGEGAAAEAGGWSNALGVARPGGMVRPDVTRAVAGAAADAPSRRTTSRGTPVRRLLTGLM